MRTLNLSLRKVLTYIGIVIFLFWCLFPIYWVVVTSIKPRVDTFAVPPIFFPTRVSGEAMKYIFSELVHPGVLNSIVVSLVSTFIVLVIGSMAGFGFSRLRFRGRRDLMFWILSLRMFPPIVVIIPLFFLFRLMNLIDTRAVVIFVYLGINLPFTVWIMKTFFDELPVEIEEAALIDGCSIKQVFFRIALPLSKPGIIAATIFSFIFAWNEFLFALILTRTRAVTAPVVLSSLEGTGGIYWNRIAAFSAIIIIPVIILCATIQRHIVRGLTFGAIKE
jgi:multiple sugar transport system permease protein